MTSFEEFHQSLLELIKSFEEKKTQLKLETDLESNIIKIFGENIDSLSRAKNGLEDVSELANTAAEHHPYWNLLYSCSQISQTILEKWDGDLSKDELEEIEWSIKELQHTCNKLKEQKTD
ncbi:MAG: hypothetical protein IH780_05285 [Thaumarchaeota archaeon]|jgi:hypothetical protein|nr:hypothetical protein [Nitrososphaerota archaeon]MCH8324165.1 hypothetical protein [Nitrososphaerota archaeon]